MTGVTRAPGLAIASALFILVGRAQAQVPAPDLEEFEDFLSSELHPPPPEGCIAGNPVNLMPPGSSGPCTYAATAKGSVVALGDWMLTISREGQGEITIRSTDASSNPACLGGALAAHVGPVTTCAPGTIRPRDVVTATATSTGSLVAALAQAEQALAPSGSGCSSDRPATVHSVGGVAIAAPAGIPIPVPCETRIGYQAYEPMIDFSERGDDVSWFFYAAGIPSFESTIRPSAAARSKDGGASWELVYPNIEGVATHLGSSDPVIRVDHTTSRLFALEYTCTSGGVLSFSDDDGETWHHSLAGCSGLYDHQSLVTARAVTSKTFGYPNVVYLCGSDLTAPSCEKSLDGGATFMPAGAPAFVEQVDAATGAVCFNGSGLTGQVAAGSDGVLYLGKANWCPETAGAPGTQPWMAISHDEGLTWSRVRVAMSPSSGGHDANVAVDADGNVYYAWIGGDRLPYLAVSRDGGSTFGAPMMIGAPGVNEANIPAIDVAAPGKVAVAYMGTANSPGAPFPTEECSPESDCPERPEYAGTTWNGYITMTTTVLDPAPILFSASINDPSSPLVRGRCGPTRCHAVEDYIDVTVGPDGVPWASLIDGCPGGLCAEKGGHAIVGRLVGGPSLR